jgi:hypothetical protein
MEIVLVLAVVAAVVLLIAAPLRAHVRPSPGVEPDLSAERAELDAAKEAKLREIREAELDYHTGKLSYGDWVALDSALRSEAIDLLRQLDALSAGEQRSHAVER